MIPTRAEEWVATLKEMHEAGDSYAVIAKRLGVTKNVVVGYAKRLDLPKRVDAAQRRVMTPKLQAVLDLLERRGRARGWCPTNDEILEVMGAESVASAVNALTSLAALGHIKIERISANRRRVMAADRSWVVETSPARKPNTAPPPPAVQPRIWPPVARAPREQAPALPAPPPAPPVARDEVSDDQARDHIAHIRAQVAAVTARADGGPSPRRCQFPMWPHSAPTPRLDAHLDVRTTFGPHLLCGAPSVPGRSWCAACCARVFTPRERAA